MMQGLYAGAASLQAFEERQDALAANLANISTPGYRQRVEVMSSMEMKGRNGRGQRGARGIHAPRFNMAVDFRPGEINQTGGDFDVALMSIDPKDGNAFLAVGTDQGEQYTRNGRLSLDGQGNLVHASTGFKVLSPGGSSITLNSEGGPPIIDNRGNISQDGITVGQLKVVGFGDLLDLEPANEGLYTAGMLNPVESAIGRVEVLQGYLESSNAGAVDELVEMVTNFRSYEAAQRVIRQMDESMQRLIRQTAP